LPGQLTREKAILLVIQILVLWRMLKIDNQVKFNLELSEIHFAEFDCI
jgi:hypothetical protein